MRQPHRFCLIAALCSPLLVNAAVPVAPAAPEIAAIGLIAQVEMCQQRQPALANALGNALGGWSSRNGNLIEAAKNFPGYQEAIVDARKSLTQNGASFSRESCSALLNSLTQ